MTPKQKKRILAIGGGTAGVGLLSALIFTAVLGGPDDTIPPRLPEPASFKGVEVTNRRAAELELSWSSKAVSDSSTFVEWDVRCIANTTISDVNWSSAMQFSGEPTPSRNFVQSMRVSSDINGNKIRAGSSWSCGIKGKDRNGVWSPSAAFSTVPAASVGLIPYDTQFTGYSGGGTSFAYWYFQGVSTGGDLNGDGYDDLLLGYGVGLYGPPEQTKRRAASIILGSINGPTLGSKKEITCTSGTNGFGVQMVAIGDFDGANYSEEDPHKYTDFAISDTDAQKVYIFRGHSGIGTENIDCSQADIVIIDTDPVGCFGVSVSSVGDFDGDGRSDIYIGDPCAGAAYNGAASLIFGREETSYPVTINMGNGQNADGAIKIPGKNGSSVGLHATGADLNGDGKSDWVVSFPTASKQAPACGVTDIFFGKTVTKSQNSISYMDELDADEAIWNPGFKCPSGTFHGYPNAQVVMDWDGDGCPDILVGGQGYEYNIDENSGAVLLWLNTKTDGVCTGNFVQIVDERIVNGLGGKHVNPPPDALGMPIANFTDVTKLLPSKVKFNGMPGVGSDVALIVGSSQFQSDDYYFTGDGAVYFWWAGFSGFKTTAQYDIKFDTPSGGVNYFYVQFVGDLDGDGYVDMAILDVGYGSGGRATIFH